LKNFSEYLKEGIARKTLPDKKRASSLIENSDKRNFFFEQIINAVDITDDNANYVIEQVYDILIELIRAKIIFDGYYASGNYAHEAEVSYLKELNFTDFEISMLDEIRKFRNGVKYYGKRYNKNEAESSIRFKNSVINKLKEKIR